MRPAPEASSSAPESARRRKASSAPRAPKRATPVASVEAQTLTAHLRARHSPRIELQDHERRDLDRLRLVRTHVPRALARAPGRPRRPRSDRAVARRQRRARPEARLIDAARVVVMLLGPQGRRRSSRSWSRPVLALRHWPSSESSPRQRVALSSRSRSPAPSSSALDSTSEIDRSGSWSPPS